ncbi:MAG TPA: DNA mismatch repair protein MutS [Candidatus Limnocylindria bacterium]|nr:DNA mismatch repair protein MutS [Candidatus Limnocylindria bacterium]
MAELTPMMRQYLELKEEHPDALLFFRLGDFYELFFDDAKTASRELELTLTGRDCGMAERAPMCGVPWHAADAYVARLIARGYRVAIAEQTEDPALAKALVRRSVIRVVTPGTFAGPAAQAQARNRFVAAVHFAGRRAGVALCDVNTGEFFVRAFPEGDEAAGLFLAARDPGEAVTSDPERLLAVYRGFTSPVRAETFRLGAAREALLKHFGAASAQGLGIGDRDEMLLCPAGALLSYLGATQKADLRHIARLTVLTAGDAMPLPPTTLRSLELTSGLREGSGATLLSVLDRTVTAMGLRLLRSWVERPLVDKAAIEKRLDSVGALVDDPTMLARAAALLDGVSDLERIASRLSYRTMTPRDCLALLKSLQAAPELGAALSATQDPGLADIRERLRPRAETAALLERAISPDAPALLADGGAIREGYDPRLDEARLMARDGRKWISDLEAREREATGIRSLRVQYNRVFGYFIEVTRSNLASVPAGYVRRQTLANAERYTTDELAGLERKVLGAQDEASRLEGELYAALLDTLTGGIADLQDLAGAVKELDALQSLARAAADNRYCKPAINAEGRLDIRDGRHPVVEKALGEGSFVPNDTQMGGGERLLVITGPNMAGKSTYLRQTALIALMAHMGSFVPAASADIPLLDNVYTRIGAQDDLAAGLSTFMVEMSELSHILRGATNRSLVILDEIGRGTGTLDGLSIAWATVEYLADEKACGALALFATHYHELGEMEGALPGVVNLSVTTREVGDEVVFLHRMKRGGADKSFGVYVARMAGVPGAVVSRAREIMARLEASDITQDAIGRNILERRRKRKPEQMALPDVARAELVNELAGLDVLQMTPMEALSRLMVLKEKARKV